MVVIDIQKSRSGLLAQRFLVIALVVSLVFVFFACGKPADKKADDTPEPAPVSLAESLVGTWVRDDAIGEVSFIFREDGTGEAGMENNMEDFIWKVNGETITIDWSDVHSPQWYKLSENTLEVHDNQGDSVDIYTRK